MRRATAYKQMSISMIKLFHIQSSLLVAKMNNQPIAIRSFNRKQFGKGLYLRIFVLVNYFDLARPDIADQTFNKFLLIII